MDDDLLLILFETSKLILHLLESIEAKCLWISVDNDHPIKPEDNLCNAVWDCSLLPWR